jgi:hypothetical protein
VERVVDLETILKVLPQGTAVAAVVAVTTMILLKYIPALIKEFRDTVTGLVSVQADSLKEERLLFREEMKELRITFSTGVKDMTNTFKETNGNILCRLDDLAKVRADGLCQGCEFRTKLEK